MVVAVAEAVGDAEVEFGEAVDGFGAAVAGAAGVEVGQECAAPAVQGLAELGNLGDGAGRERRDDFLGESAAGGQGGRVVDGPDLLKAVPSQSDFVVTLVDLKGAADAGELAVGGLFRPGVQ